MESKKFFLQPAMVAQKNIIIIIIIKLYFICKDVFDERGKRQRAEMGSRFLKLMSDLAPLELLPIADCRLY
jgi:hypothetical protein